MSGKCGSGDVDVADLCEPAQQDLQRRRQSTHKQMRERFKNARREQKVHVTKRLHEELFDSTEGMGKIALHYGVKELLSGVYRMGAYVCLGSEVGLKCLCATRVVSE